MALTNLFVSGCDVGILENTDKLVLVSATLLWRDSSRPEPVAAVVSLVRDRVPPRCDAEPTIGVRLPYRRFGNSTTGLPQNQILRHG